MLEATGDTLQSSTSSISELTQDGMRITWHVAHMRKKRNVATDRKDMQPNLAHVLFIEK